MITKRLKNGSFFLQTIYIISCCGLFSLTTGNSGGPVLDEDNKVIGVAFQSLSDEDIENIGTFVQ